MKRPSSKQMTGMRKQLRTQPEKPIDNESSSEDDNIEQLSNVIEKKEAYYRLLEDVEPSTESDEEEAAHASTRRTVSLASNKSSSKKENVEELSAIESEEKAYDIEEDLELSSESEEEGAAHLSTQRTLASRFIYGVNKCFEWSVTPLTEKKQTEADEEWNYEPEVLSDAKDKDTPIELWSLLFTDEMLSIIVEYTKVELSQKREDNESNRSLEDINLEELKASFGILYFSRLQKNSGNLTKLWKSSPVFS